MQPVCRTRYITIEEAGRKPSSEFQVGDLFFAKLHEPNQCTRYDDWADCDGYHLHCVIPGTHGLRVHHWDIDSRASNCTARWHRHHRCWARFGDPQYGSITVCKTDVVPHDGAGSILVGGLVGGWHGFLRDGMLLHDPI